MSDKLVEVVAGVLQDARGRILLARRTEGRDLAGLWEFPGGKREPGEIAAKPRSRASCTRNSASRSRSATPLICVPQRYPHKRLRWTCAGSRHGAACRKDMKGRRWRGCRSRSSRATRCRPPIGRWSPHCCSPIVTSSRPRRSKTRNGCKGSIARSRAASAASSCGGQRQSVPHAGAGWRSPRSRVAVPLAPMCWSTAISRWRSELGHRRAPACRATAGAGQAAAGRWIASWPRPATTPTTCSAPKRSAAISRCSARCAPRRRIRMRPASAGRRSPGCANRCRCRSMRSAEWASTTFPLARAHGAQGIAAIRGLWQGLS